MAMVYLPFIPMSEIKNRSAYHEYFIDDKYEAGMVLMGTEVKSIRQGKVSFNDSYCLLHKGEVFVKSLHIAEYSHGNINNHEPSRDRKLLLQKKEIRKIESKLKEKGYTLIPLRIYFNEKGTGQNGYRPGERVKNFMISGKPSGKKTWKGK